MNTGDANNGYCGQSYMNSNLLGNSKNYVYLLLLTVLSKTVISSSEQYVYVVCIAVWLLLGTQELGQNVSILKLDNSNNIDDVDADEGSMSSGGPVHVT